VRKSEEPKGVGGKRGKGALACDSTVRGGLDGTLPGEICRRERGHQEKRRRGGGLKSRTRKEKGISVKIGAERV